MSMGRLDRWRWRLERWLGRRGLAGRRRLSLPDFRQHRNMHRLADGRWRADNNDPYLRCPLVLPAGWYRLRVCIRVAQRLEDPWHGNARVFVDHGQGESETLAMGLPFRSGVPAQRFLKLTAPAWLRFDPIEFAGEFELLDLVVERVDDVPEAVTGDWERYNRGLERPREETIHFGRWLAELEPGLRADVRSGFESEPGQVVCTVLSSERAQRESPQVFAEEAGDAVEPLLAAAECLTVEDAQGLSAALQRARGDWILFRFGPDRVALDCVPALGVVSAQHPDARVVYSDHDWLDERGFRCEPCFKPAWSPDRQRLRDTVGPAVWFRRDWLLERLAAHPGGWSEDGIGFRRKLLEVVGEGEIVHVSLLLYHVSAAASGFAIGSGTIASEPIASPASVRATAAETAGTVPVSLLIPTRDGGGHLRRCVESIERTADGRPLEVLLIDNQSSDPDTLAFLDACARNPGLPAGMTLRVLRHDAPFNFSAINNRAAAVAGGEVLGLVNDDVEAIGPGWLEPLVARAMEPGIGCVGPVLLYPDGRVQHAGVACGVGGVAAHPHRYWPGDHRGYGGWLHDPRNVSVVTGAALFLRRALYQELGGMDEELGVAYNDVDLCLKALASGQRTLLLPEVRLLHHESLSRGDDRSGEKAARLERESEWLRQRWGALLDEDPWYNPNLSETREDFTLSSHPRFRIRTGLSQVRLAPGQGLA